MSEIKIGKDEILFIDVSETLDWEILQGIYLQPQSFWK